jgi:D-inositol-3-phosphate glycosyltransferase
MRAGTEPEEGAIRSEDPGDRGKIMAESGVDPEVTLLTGGFDKHYTLDLAHALASKGVALDLIGGDDLDGPEMRSIPGVNFLNMRNNRQPDANCLSKVWRVLVYYFRLILYTWSAKPRVFHILWNNRFQFFDRTLLMLYYKLQGKKIVFTAHNTNSAKRDMKDSLLNRLSLRIQYRLADRIFVHTSKMKSELVHDFGVNEKAITVIPYGINNAVPLTDMTPADAKRQLHISSEDKTILFFGSIRPYKGLEYLIAAFEQALMTDVNYRLIIAGRPARGYEAYWEEILEAIRHIPIRGRVTVRDEHIPDEDVELYFKAADVLALPYTEIFQSGVLFLGHSFGLPVIASDVGSLKEEIVAGQTGFICRPCDPVDLARTIDAYFRSDLFKTLNTQRQEIRDYVSARHSWSHVADITRTTYADLYGASHARELATVVAPGTHQSE